MIKQRQESSIMEMVEDSLLGIAKVKDISVTLKKFYKLKYAKPKTYTVRDIRKLRKELRISQAVLAHLLNTKLSTVQKWERGINVPSGSSSRLLQILTKQGPKVFVTK